uniref:Uncharacterized protein n=1 Tax=Rhizophora mucronata TaxID=61149 RepID=A0A2P2PVL8_RHIMU
MLFNSCLVCDMDVDQTPEFQLGPFVTLNALMCSCDSTCIMSMLLFVVLLAWLTIFSKEFGLLGSMPTRCTTPQGLSLGYVMDQF